MKRVFGTLAVVALALAVAGCSSAQTPVPETQSLGRKAETAEQIAKRIDLPLTGTVAKSVATTLPTSFTGLPWAHYQSACIQGGFDLRPYAGRATTFRAYDTTDPRGPGQRMLWVIYLDGDVIGAYEAVEGVMPGISGVGNPSN